MIYRIITVLAIVFALSSCSKAYKSYTSSNNSGEATKVQASSSSETEKPSQSNYSSSSSSTNYGSSSQSTSTGTELVAGEQVTETQVERIEMTDMQRWPLYGGINPDLLTPPTKGEAGSKDEVAVIHTKLGKMVVEFFPDIAPLHVANFKKLARVGFYDGTTFHRVLPGFVIQGGDPLSKDDNPHNDGTGGPPYQVKAEFNKTPHELGILSMARSQDVNSAGSQFFIVLGKAPHLDNQYTVFGKVIKGLDVVETIGKNRRDPSNRNDRTLPAVIMSKVEVVNRAEAGL